MAAGDLRLQLFVASGQPSSEQARSNLERTLTRLGIDSSVLEVVDVLDDPGRAWAEKVLTTPAMIRLSPEPRIRLVGTLEDRPSLERTLGAAGGPDRRDEPAAR